MIFSCNKWTSVSENMPTTACLPVRTPTFFGVCDNNWTLTSYLNCEKKDQAKTSLKHSLKCVLVTMVMVCLDVRVGENHLCIFMTCRG